MSEFSRIKPITHADWERLNTLENYFSQVEIALSQDPSKQVSEIFAGDIRLLHTLGRVKNIDNIGQNGTEAQSLEFAGWTYNPNTRELEAEGQKTRRLSKTENTILLTFHNLPGELITYSDLADSIHKPKIKQDALEQVVRTFRHKIDMGIVSPKRIIRSISSTGYIYNPLSSLTEEASLVGDGSIVKSIWGKEE